MQTLKYWSSPLSDLYTIRGGGLQIHTSPCSAVLRAVTKQTLSVQILRPSQQHCLLASIHPTLTHSPWHTRNIGCSLVQWRGPPSTFSASTRKQSLQGAASLWTTQLNFHLQSWGHYAFWRSPTFLTPYCFFAILLGPDCRRGACYPSLCSQLVHHCMLLHSSSVSNTYCQFEPCRSVHFSKNIMGCDITLLHIIFSKILENDVNNETGLYVHCIFTLSYLKTRLIHSCLLHFRCANSTLLEYTWTSLSCNMNLCVSLGLSGNQYPLFWRLMWLLK